eukprot:c34425_g1_i1 orf=208-396(-)
MGNSSIGVMTRGLKMGSLARDMIEVSSIGTWRISAILGRSVGISYGCLVLSPIDWFFFQTNC